MHSLKWFNIMIVCFISLQLACTNVNDSEKGKKSVYVKSSIDYKGKFRKGHIRKPVSTDKNAIKNRNKSKYYYKTRGKYMRKKK